MVNFCNQKVCFIFLFLLGRTKKPQKTSQPVWKNQISQLYPFLCNSGSDTKSDLQIKLTRNFIQTDTFKMGMLIKVMKEVLVIWRCNILKLSPILSQGKGCFLYFSTDALLNSLLNIF